MFTIKNGKRPTVAQKKLMKEWRLNPDNWLVVKATSTETVFVNRWSGKTKTIPVGGRL